MASNLSLMQLKILIMMCSIALPSDSSAQNVPQFGDREQLLPQPPNIVVILADDIGVGDISFYRNRFSKRKPVVSTANIDALAQQGVWFADAHSATALCAPTRYAVMTGKNNYRSYAPWGVWGSFQPNAISAEEPTLGNVLKMQGYNTGFIGK
ncbi:sulfatase-like hydrolase/transferase [Agaribacter marinus]|uniref:Sulfatase N-terminal domain-containing protein n=1 Tax=Agaribacter marinus TaxID=1431249 RepID=A0AA37WJW1_9ALTE|nr:sulfatase-like hydrolase/transferase [Agaribacter marinus]GLR70699.1 hypothetical protein GCM10007852_16070 [Agaribacter marinus]